MILFIFIHLVKSSFLDFYKNDETFSFIGQNNKELILTNPKKHILNKRHNIMGNKNNEFNQGYWYYIHFLTNDLSEIQKYIQVRNTDFLFKKTFVLFLSSSQLEKISNISLVKKIEPYEKYIENGVPLEKTDFLIICTSIKYKLPH